MKRKIKELTRGNITVKVHYSSDWEEYRVSLYLNGVHQGGSTYHTDDKHDAIETAQAMLYVSRKRSA